MQEIKIVNQENDLEPKNFSKGYLTFPFDISQFKDFITGLLGKPQTISKRISGNFEVQLSDLQSFYELVNQRVTQQNNGQLIQFTAKIFFTDRSAVQLGSYNELVTYNEVKPIISEAVKLTWDYLIQFSDKTHPEKQVIELLIISATEKAVIEDDDVPSFLYVSKGEFRINIEHTARSFGSDIENTLTNQIESLLKKENKFKRFVRRHSSKFSLGFSFLFLLTSIFGAYLATSHFIENEMKRVQTYTNSAQHTVNEKVDFLTSYMASGVSSQHYFKVVIFLLISVILSILFGVWIEETASNNRELSFVTLTRKAKDYRDEIRKKMEHKWTWFLISIGTSIATGIIANIIFNFLVEKP
ncbi:MAG: hypothetical protein PHV20_08090 [Bacteroidales bacterium]|nr:hypothetical protein [Bacteroidales bacterium]